MRYYSRLLEDGQLTSAGSLISLHQNISVLNNFMDDQYKQKLLELHPYLSIIAYGGNEYIGVIQNVDDYITTIYDFSMLKTNEQKITYLQLAEEWWWESNRMCPINLFLKDEWAVFRPTLRTLNSKEVEIKFGPHLSLKEVALRKGKRRSITLVRRVN